MADNYAEQQADEMEALESIFMTDLKEVTTDTPSGWHPPGKVYSIELEPQLEEGLTSDNPLRVEVVFAHTPTYPDEAPLVKARALQGLADSDVAFLQAELNDEIEANLGVAMVYSLVTRAQEWLDKFGAAAAEPSVNPDAERKRQQDAEEARIAALRAHGTAVTPETFAEWKARFDAEVALARAAVGDAVDVAVGPDGKPKLTGKQWFMQQEAQHIDIDEPELDEDGEDGIGSWSGGEEGDEEEEEDLEISEDEDDDDLLNSYLAEAG